jgi:hypothetical protein
MPCDVNLPLTGNRPKASLVVDNTVGGFASNLAHLEQATDDSNIKREKIRSYGSSILLINKAYEVGD